MDPRPEQEARVRGQPERRAVETEEWFVHGGLPRPLSGQDRGRDEDDQLAVRVRRPRFRLEEPAENRNVAEERHLLDGLHHVLLADATDRQGLALFDDDLRRGGAPVDARNEASSRLRDVVESIQKVPFFGDIPILGWLFKSKSRTTDPNRELVIFITPTILPTQRPR